MASPDIELVAAGGARRPLRVDDGLTAAAIENAEAGANAWIKGLRHARVDGRPFRERFVYRGDSLWWFAELYLHKRRVIVRALRTAAALDAVADGARPAALRVLTADPVIGAAAAAWAARRRIAVDGGSPGATLAERARLLAKASFHTATALLDRVRPSAAASPARATVAAFVHSAFWRGERGESYLGPVLDRIEAQRPGSLALVGVGPRTNFRIRGWRDRLAEFRDPAARDLPLTPIESYAGWHALDASRRVWRDRHATRAALQASADIRAHAIVDGLDLWPLVSGELAGIAELQFPWSARSMDEAAAAFDALHPAAALTYAEAGGWGRALLLEARRRRIATIGVQHGFIYRHWLNYRHEPDEMAAAAGNAADAGFPLPTRTLLFDGVAAAHLADAGQFPPGSTTITGSPSLERFLATAAALDETARAVVRAEVGVGDADHLVLLAAKHAQLGTWFRTLVSAVAKDRSIVLVVKPHPAEGGDPYLREAAAVDRVRIAPAGADLARLTVAARAVVTANSTAAIEALAVGVPALVVGLPNNLSPFVDAGVMAGVSDPADLPGLLSRVVADEPYRAGLRARAAEFAARFAIVQPPGAADRAARAILELALH